MSLKNTTLNIEDLQSDFHSKNNISTSTGLNSNTTEYHSSADQLNSFEIPLTVAKVTFLVLGMALQSLIIYFEMFGRDSQKRGLINRVSEMICIFS